MSRFTPPPPIPDAGFTPPPPVPDAAPAPSGGFTPPPPVPDMDYGSALRAAKAEIDALNASQIAAGREPLSQGAQLALADRYRMDAGAAPIGKQMDELNRVDYGAREESQQGPIADILSAPAQSLTGIGTGIVGAFSPETAQRMNQNIDAYYGQGGRTTGARVYGGTIGNVANVIAAGPAGAAGMAGIYGASGVGSTRTDIADRRDAGEEISAADEAVASGLIGAAEGLSGLITGGILNRAKGVFSGVGLGTLTKEAGAKGIRSLIRAELPELVTEVGEEMATQLFTNAVKQSTYAEDQTLWDGVTEAGYMSLIPVLAGRQVAARVPQNRAEYEARQDAKRGVIEPGPMPQGEFVDGATPAVTTSEQVGPALPMTGPSEFIGATPTQVFDEQVSAGQVPQESTTDAPTVSDPQLQMYLDDLIRKPIFEQQVGRREAVPGEMVGADASFPASARPTLEAPVETSADLQNRLDTPLFPQRLETTEDVKSFFGTMEDDAGLLASYTNEPMVLVDIPVADIPVQELGVEGEISEDKLSTIRDGDPFTQPPIMAIDNGGDLFIPDGNHRVMVARERGDTSIKGYVPESLAQERGLRDVTVQRPVTSDIEAEAEAAGLIRRTPAEPSARQKKLMNLEADRAVQLQAEQAEMEDVATTHSGFTTVGSDVSTGSSVTHGPGDPGPQFGRGSRGNPIFPSAFPQPTAKMLTSLAGTAEKPGKMGAFTRKMKSLLRDPTTGVLGSIEGRKIEAKGRNTLAALEVRRVTRELNKLAKKNKIDINGDADIQMELENMLRTGNVTDPRVREVLNKYRRAIDASSQTLADAQKAAGIDATVIENNIGNYVQSVTRESVERARGILQKGAKEFAPSKGFRKVKRDAYIVWKGEVVHGKYNTPEEAVAARDALIAKRKNNMIQQGAKLRGVTDKDLNNQAARDITIEEPISAQQREETEIHDIRFLTTKTVLDNLHNASVIDLHVAAAATYGTTPPAGLKPSETAAWANQRGLVPLPGKNTLHALDVYVPKEVATRLDEYTNLASGVNEFLLRHIVRPWKAAMTIFRPATWGRNMIGSQIHAVLDGASIFDPRNLPAYAQAVQELAKGDTSPLVRRLIERGAMDSDYSVTEARDVALRVGQTGTVQDALMGGWRAFKGAAAKGYQYPDNLAKVASVLIHQGRDGMSLDNAILEMEKYQPIYPRISRLATIARDNVFLGAPFVSYMDQSFRNVSRAIVARGEDGTSLNPNLHRVGMLLMAPYMIDQLSRAAIGMDDEDDRILERSSPADYFIKTLASPVVYNPFSKDGRDGKGRPMALNLRYITPIIHDLLPSMNNGSLQIPYGVSGPIIDTIIEQITGKERFSGFDFLTDEMTLKEQMKARGERLLATLVPLPPEVKDAAPRVRKAVKGQSEEPVANALLATLTGIDTRTPYIAEQTVKDLINNAIDAGETGEALAILELWNNEYKPGNKERLNPAKALSGYKGSLRSKRANAVRKAGDALFLGKRGEAEAIIKKYNKDRGEVAPELSMEEIEGAVSTTRDKGRDY